MPFRNPLSFKMKQKLRGRNLMKKPCNLDNKLKKIKKIKIIEEKIVNLMKLTFKLNKLG